MMDWLRNGNPQSGGNCSFPQHPFSSRQSNSVPASPAPTSAHRSPAQVRSFIARYSDCSTPLPPSFRAKSAPVTSVNLDSTVRFPIPVSRPDPTAVHPVTLKISSAPSILTPPPSSPDQGEDLEPLFEPTTDAPASIAPPLLLHPRIPSPSSVQDLMETSHDKHTIYGVTASMLLDWQEKYSFVMDSELINYQYDQSTSRFIISCSPSPAHDSLQIYIQGRLSVELPARMGTNKFLSCLQISCGSGFGGFTGRQYLLSRKQPDASLQVKGDDFPSVVCESGWAEKMDDLRRDAELWLLHTDGQTAVVLVLAFTESFGDDGDTALTAGVPDPPAAVVEPDTNQEASQATSDPESSETSDSPTEESLLLSRITDATTPRALAADLLDLHRRHQLSKPLLGRIHATMHVFHANDSLTAIEESYTAVLLPAPADMQQQAFTLTMFDLLGDLAEDEGIDPDEEVVFPLDALREVVREQIPKMERMTSADRAASVLKGLGLWQEVETFAQYKRSRKRRRIL